jgi:two-component system sensor histidine kinase PhoQ
MPCIVLWNPYDVGLNNATYDLELQFSPSLWKGFVCKPNPTLLELQAQAGANWTADPNPAVASTRRTLGEPVAVAPQADRVLASLQKVYSHKSIRTAVRIEPELKFFGEKRDLLEVMGNLFDNAFKYGGGAVRIAAGVLGADQVRPGMWLTVEDDGPGIDPARWTRLLQRGVRGDERVEGHGLGLAIVLELVSAYGGDISISKSDLGGACLRVELAPT